MMTDNGDDNNGNGNGTPQPAKPEKLEIRVRDQNNQEVTFQVKPSTKFKKIMDAYCSREGKDLASVRFLFDGSRINPNQTPEEVEMEDGDMIEIFQEQQGGAADDDAPPKPELLNIKVKDSNDNELFFKVKPHTKFRKLFYAYCNQRGMELNTVRFVFENTRLLDDQSPQEVDMEDHDVIDVFQEQQGGYYIPG